MYDGRRRPCSGKMYSFCLYFIQHEPWLKLKDDSSNRVGNDRYEGYLIDLITALGQKLGANFDIHVAGDGRYGAPTEAGTWTGIRRV